MSFETAYLSNHNLRSFSRPVVELFWIRALRWHSNLMRTLACEPSPGSVECEASLIALFHDVNCEASQNKQAKALQVLPSP